MALQPCPECKEEISTLAHFCPKCGYPFEQIQKSPTGDGPQPVSPIIRTLHILFGAASCVVGALLLPSRSTILGVILICSGILQLLLGILKHKSKPVL
jgi:hypothetical protein